MRFDQFGGELLSSLSRPFPIDELEKIEPDSHAFNYDQADDVFDVLNITIEGEKLFFRTNQDHSLPMTPPRATTSRNLLQVRFHLAAVSK